MFFVVEERRKGLIYDIDLGWVGGGYTGKGDKYVHYAKKAPLFGSVSTVLSLIA